MKNIIKCLRITNTEDYKTYLIDGLLVSKEKERRILSFSRLIMENVYSFHSKLRRRKSRISFSEDHKQINKIYSRYFSCEYGIKKNTTRIYGSEYGKYRKQLNQLLIEYNGKPLKRKNKRGRRK